jgi:uncharacterized small protein (DUF1192 family)
LDFEREHCATLHATVPVGETSSVKQGPKRWRLIRKNCYRAKKAPEIVLGQDLSAMSEFELGARITALEAEIARCREAIVARRATKSAADSFFKR